jgi:hypothetical protein
MDAPDPQQDNQLDGNAGAQWEENRRKNAPRLLADDRFSKALEALCKFGVQDSIPQRGQEFRDAVPVLASFAVQKVAGRESFEQLWAQGTKKSWKALTEFPNRIRSMGTEIEQLIRSHFFAPERLVADKVPEDNVPVLVNHFSNLPVILYYFANAIEAITQELPAETSNYYYRGRGNSPWIGELSNLVNRLTGRFHDKEVAELLNAAEAVLHPNKRGNDKGFDAQTLADFRSRRKSRAITT